jgi:TolB-like protein/Flp pilus assembly protein TadD
MRAAFDQVKRSPVGNQSYPGLITGQIATGFGAFDAIHKRDGSLARPALQPVPPVSSLPLPTSFSAFVAALKDALRNFSRPDLLERNPLLHSRLMTTRDPAPDDLQALLKDAVDKLFSSPRDEKLRQIIALTYFQTSLKQEAIADRLHVPFGTYRRHLTTALERLGQWLWQREQAGWPNDGQMLKSTRSEAFAPPRLSIVVLPFVNHASDAEEQGYFVDGITENLTTDLSRIPGAFVIACNTAFSYKGKSIDIRQIGRDLGVRYVLEGSVQIGAKLIRVNAQLIDTETGAHVWAERFDKTRAELFDMQNEITTRLARSVDIEIIGAESRRAERERADNLDSVDLTMRGRAIWNQQPLSLENVGKARQHFEAALLSDEANVPALLGLANTHMWEVNTFASDDRMTQIAVADAAVSKATELASASAYVHLTRGTVLLAMREPDSALREFELATILDSNLAEAHAYIGISKLYLGRAEETEVHVKYAMRLSPRDPFSDKWYLFIGVADLYLGKIEQAVNRLRKSVEINPSWGLYWYILSAALVRSGRQEEALAACSTGRRLAPNFTIGKLRAQPVSDSPVHLAHREQLYQALREVGVPEG